MVASKVLRRGEWWAWLGVNLEHVRKDVERDGEWDLSTLQPVPFAEVDKMEFFAAGLQAVREVEQQYGSNAPFVPGKTSYFLGKLKKVS